MPQLYRALCFQVLHLEQPLVLKIQSIGARVARWLKRAWMWIGLAISILALWLALRGLDLSHLWNALITANYVWLIPALIFHFASLVTRSLRWQVLLGTDKVDLATSFWVENIGYLVGNVIHARVGDAARVVIINQRKPVSIEHALSTVVVERIFDLLAVVVMALALIPVMQIPPEWLSKARILGALGIVGVLAAITLVALGEFTERLLAAILSRVRWIKPEPWLARWHNLVGGFSALGSVRGVLVVLMWTAATWIFAIGVFWAVMMAFMPQAPFQASVFVLAAEAFGLVVPATPGNWGVWEAIAKESLRLAFGLPEPQAMSFGLVVHVFEYAAANIVGLIGMVRYSLTISDLKSQISD